MIDNLVNQNNLSEEMYNKVLRVIKAIDTEIMQYEKIEHKLACFSSRDASIERMNVINEIEILKNIRHNIQLIVGAQVYGADELVYGIRREHGDEWYLKFDILKKQDNSQRFIVGLAYEILYGNVTESHFWGRISRSVQAVRDEEVRKGKNKEFDSSRVILWIGIIISIFLILGIWI